VQLFLNNKIIRIAASAWGVMYKLGGQNPMGSKVAGIPRYGHVKLQQTCSQAVSRNTTERHYF